MSRQEAEARAAELNREHPDRARYRWLARQDGDAWLLARVSLPPGLRVDPLKNAVESKPRPPQADDPRPPMWRDVGGPYGPG